MSNFGFQYKNKIHHQPDIRSQFNEAIIVFIRCIRFIFLCFSPESESESTDTSSPKVTVTGVRVNRSELPAGPKLSARANEKTKSNNVMSVFAEMQSLPEPKAVGDCKGLLIALEQYQLSKRILDKNTVVIETEHGIYTYTFDDNTCPVNET